MDYEHSLFVHTPAFSPTITGEEMCRAVAPIGDHVLAIVPKGREVWEVFINEAELRDKMEVEGLVLRGRVCEVSPRFPGGTWVRVRGLPLNATNAYLDRLLSEYGEVVVACTHSTWRNTNIRTGDRTLKVKVRRDIPGKVMTSTFGWLSFRYRGQPDLCFTCGQAGHQQWACEVSGGGSYAAAVQQVATAPSPAPTYEDVATSSPTLSTDPENSDDDDQERKKKKKEKKERKVKEREKKEKKRELSPDTPPERAKESVGKHGGLPTMAPTSALYMDKRKK